MIIERIGRLDTIGEVSKQEDGSLIGTIFFYEGGRFSARIVGEVTQYVEDEKIFHRFIDGGHGSIWKFLYEDSSKDNSKMSSRLIGGRLVIDEEVLTMWAHEGH